MFPLLVNLVLTRKLIPFLNLELSSLKSKVYVICRNVFRKVGNCVELFFFFLTSLLEYKLLYNGVLVSAVSP